MLGVTPWPRNKAGVLFGTVTSVIRILSDQFPQPLNYPTFSILVTNRWHERVDQIGYNKLSYGIVIS